MKRFRCRTCGRFTRVTDRRDPDKPPLYFDEEPLGDSGIVAKTPVINSDVHHCDNCGTTWSEQGFCGEPMGITLEIIRHEEPVSPRSLRDIFEGFENFEERYDGISPDGDGAQVLQRGRAETDQGTGEDRRRPGEGAGEEE